METKLESKIGVRMLYCGHKGWFMADIIVVAGAAIVRAPGPVMPGNITRHNIESCQYHIHDTPEAGFWRPDLGIFVVPVDQVVAIDFHKKDDDALDISKGYRDPKKVMELILDSISIREDTQSPNQWIEMDLIVDQVMEARGRGSAIYSDVIPYVGGILHDMEASELIALSDIERSGNAIVGCKFGHRGLQILTP